MRQFLYRAAIGLLGGVLSGLVAFEAISVAFFALGQYSQPVLREGMFDGIVTGAIFGPVFALRRTRWARAAAWEAAILATRYVALGIWEIASASVYSPAGEAVTSIVRGTLYFALAGAPAGAATVWVVSLLERYRLPKRPSPPQTSSTSNRERRYDL